MYKKIKSKSKTMIKINKTMKNKNKTMKNRNKRMKNNLDGDECSSNHFLESLLCHRAFIYLHKRVSRFITNKGPPRFQ